MKDVLAIKREIEERESRVTAGESKIEEKRKSLAELDKESLLVAQKIRVTI